MKTWIKTFKFSWFHEIDDEVNKFCRTRNLSPLSVSITTNCGCIYVAVVVTKESEDTE